MGNAESSRAQGGESPSDLCGSVPGGAEVNRRDVARAAFGCLTKALGSSEAPRSTSPGDGTDVPQGGLAHRWPTDRGVRIGTARPPNRSPEVRAAASGQQWSHTDDGGGWQPVVEVFNGSCWNTCKRRMAVSDASVFLLAEVRLLPHEVAAAIAWCRRRGFTALIEPAAPSSLGGMPSGGVAIVAKAELGLGPACGLDTRIAPHRAIGGAIDVPTVGRVALVAVYLDVADKWGSDNLAIMAQV